MSASHSSSRTPPSKPATPAKPGAKPLAKGGKPAAKGGRPVPKAPPHEVRLIGGLWKRTPLSVPDLPGLRPTPSRVRETLFNWLGQDLPGWRCVDAFAGSGALGLEAASRGATEVLMVEQDVALVANLRKVVQKLKASQVKVDRGDALAALQRLAGQGWDLVFLDPPFGDDGNPVLFTRALKAARAAVHDTRGLVYLESPRAWTDDELAPLGLRIQRQGKAGAVHHALLAGMPLPG
jgi:16S rRNA (guanine(966)-N(2))-methyltransferase RsmD